MSSLAHVSSVKKADFWTAPLERYAHLIIDVQKDFCAPKKGKNDNHTHDISTKIAAIKPAFMRAGIRTVIVTYRDSGSLHQISANQEDILIEKRSDCAFATSDIDNVLKQNNLTHLLVSGFNTHTCIKSTVVSGVEKKYKIILLRDLIGDSWEQFSKEAFETMEQKGAQTISSPIALAKLHEKQQQLALTF